MMTNEDSQPRGPVRPRWRLLLHVLCLLVLLLVWTWKLLEPNPVPEALEDQLRGAWRVIAAKTLHACGYAMLTLLAVTLPVPNYWRWFFVGLLALHGVASEIGQLFVPGRDGNEIDVLIDWFGIGCAVLVWRLWLTPATGETESPTAGD